MLPTLSVQFSPVAQSCPTLCDLMNRSTPGLLVHHQLTELTQTHASDAIQPPHPLSSPSPPAPNPSPHEGLFHWVNGMRWPNIGVSASASVLPKNTQDWSPLGWTKWLDGWISLQKTPWSLLQPHSSKASSFWCSAFFTVQLSHPYMTTGKTIALIRWTYVGNVMSLLFNMLSRLVITFLPRSKRLLISCLQSPSVVILEPKRIKSDTVSTVSPSISHEVMGPDAMILVLWMLSFKPTYTHAIKLLSSIFFLVILLLSHKVQGQEYSLIFNVEILASFLVDLLPDDSSPRFPRFPIWQLWMYLLNKICFSAKRVVWHLTYVSVHICVFVLLSNSDRCWKGVPYLAVSISITVCPFLLF